MCVMCMAYLIVLLEQHMRHQWRVMMVFSKGESSLAIVKGHYVSHSRHFEALLEGTKIILSLPRNTRTYNDIKAYVHQVSVKTYLGCWVDI